MHPHTDALKAASTFLEITSKLTSGNLFFNLKGSELDLISLILFGST